MRYTVTHTTTYSGAERVSVGHNEAWLRPRELAYQRSLRHALEIEPLPSTRSSRNDYFGNVVTVFSFNRGYDKLRVTATSDVLLTARPVRRDSPSSTWNAVRESLHSRRAPAELEACEYCFESPRVRMSPELVEYARPSFRADRPIVDAIGELSERIHKDFAFDSGATGVGTTVEEVFRIRRGVCQDFAHFMIATLRSLGLAARYVSGYIRTYPKAGQPRLTGADASHAWLSVYCGSLGWIDVDPTNNLFPSVDHVTVAWGRDYGDVAPLKGVYIGGGSHTLDVSVDVKPEGS